MRNLFLAVMVLVVSPAFGQVEIAVTNQQSSSYLSPPRIVAGRVIWADDYQPNIGKIAVITLETEAKNVSVTAMNAKFEFAPLETGEANEYFLATEGEWAIVATYRDESGKQWTDTEKAVVGKPKPIDPKPDPDPPKPDPDGISNVYNVGVISFQNAPRDQQLATQMASWYRVEASKLFGQNQTLSNIEKILQAIDEKFAAKQCRDLPTCQQWSVWQSKVKAALVAEQRKRNVFSKQDWWAALIEIAESLERVQ